MLTQNIFQNLNPEYIGIFLLMLSTFIIGYFSSYLLEKNKNKIVIKKLKKKITTLKQQHNLIIRNKNTNDIDTIFSEIKPKIIKVVEETQKNLIETQPKKTISKQTRTSYISYTKKKPELNFKNFGEATKSNSDDLTKLNGIGPYIEQRLNDIGIYNYDQISRLTPEDIQKITELIDFFPGRIERDNWTGQAYSILVN